MRSPLFLAAVITAAAATSTVVPRSSSVNESYTLPEAHNIKPQTSLTEKFTFNSTKECHDINSIAKNEQCQFAMDYCDDYRIGFIDYVSFYYCKNGKIFTALSYTIILITLFTTLGLTASDFLCPNLDTISKFFKMSESLSGVTLLALGNGSPDLFSTLEAMKIDSASLAIGELIGAALFITCVVVGSMAIVRPFKVAKRPFIRDILFLLASLTFTAVILSDGTISQTESLSMILLYILYVIFVICWDWVITKRRREELLTRKIRNRFVDENLATFEVQENNEVNDEDIVASLKLSDSGIEDLDDQLNAESSERFDEWAKSSTYNTIRPSILGALDFNSRMNDIKTLSTMSDMSNTDGISLKTLPLHEPTRSVPSIRMSSAPTFRDNEDDDAFLSPYEYEARISRSSPAILDGELLGEYPESFYDASPDFEDAHTLLKKQVKSFMERTHFLRKGSGMVFTLFPTLKSFRSRSLLDQVFGIICLPLITILRLTVPVIQNEDKIIVLENTWGKGFFLLMLQAIISPLITCFLIFYDDHYSLLFILVPLLISIALIILIFTIRSAYRREQYTIARTASIVLAGFGFLISISWISTIATELISVIKFFALLFGLSDAILGVTVFAIGNSLGDFISNFTIAKMGFPMMALSACFGGPLLNILLGIGGSGLYVIPSTGTNIYVHISKTLIVSGTTLFINLVFLLLVVPINKWEMNKPIGWSMIGLWSAATFICVMFELTG